MSEEKRFQDIYPAGIYRLKVDGNTIHKIEFNGESNLVVRLTCTVLSLKRGGNGTSIIFGGKRNVDLWTNTKGLEYTKKFLEATGFNGSSAQLNHTHPNHISLAGFEFDAKCEPKPDKDGKLWDRFYALPVKDINKAFENLKAPDEFEIANLDNLFGVAAKPEPVATTQPAATNKTSNQCPW